MECLLLMNILLYCRLLQMWTLLLNKYGHMIHIYFEYFFVVILIAFIYSLFELEISVIFNVKMIIGENVGFYLVLVFI